MNFFGVGLLELTVAVLIALIAFGPKGTWRAARWLARELASRLRL